MNQIIIHIKDKVRLKNILERFWRHFKKVGFWKRFIESHIQTVRSKVSKSEYVILDISYIQKKYSRMMEGLVRINDGSEVGLK